jgi:hypothetical protein
MLETVGFFDFLRKRCPQCERRGLRMVQAYRATVVVDGKRAPAAWFFYRCPRCTARFREDLGGSMRAASDDEWRALAEKA